MLKSDKYIYVVLLALCSLASCTSTGTISGSRPAIYCDSGQCAPGVKTFTSKWGPLTLNGGVSVSNLTGIAQLASAIEDAEEAASDELSKKVEGNQCGPTCEQNITGKKTYSITLNPDGMSMNALKCQKTFSTTLNLKGGGLTCDIAMLSAMTSSNTAIREAGKICESIAPECGAAKVDLELIGEDETNLKYQEDEGSFWCSVDAKATVNITCGKGNTSISSPSVQGAMIAEVQCITPLKCATVAEGTCPIEKENQ